MPDPRDRVEYARVEYAGAASGAENASCANPTAPSMLTQANYAAVLIMGPPSSVFIAHTTISQSAADGIERGWTGPVFDFGAGNAFDAVAWCHQSYPRPTTGACPMRVPCDP